MARKLPPSVLVALGLAAACGDEDPPGPVGPCLSPPYVDPLDACLNIVPVDDVGPCLEMAPPPEELGPCLSPAIEEVPEPPPEQLGPCLKMAIEEEPPPVEEKPQHTGPCLKIALPPDERPEEDRPKRSKKVDDGGADAGSPLDSVLARGGLADDVAARLKTRKG